MRCREVLHRGDKVKVEAHLFLHVVGLVAGNVAGRAARAPAGFLVDFDSCGGGHGGPVRGEALELPRRDCGGRSGCIDEGLRRRVGEDARVVLGCHVEAVAREGDEGARFRRQPVVSVFSHRRHNVFEDVLLLAAGPDILQHHSSLFQHDLCGADVPSGAVKPGGRHANETCIRKGLD